MGLCQACNLAHSHSHEKDGCTPITDLSSESLTALELLSSATDDYGSPRARPRARHVILPPNKNNPTPVFFFSNVRASKNAFTPSRKVKQVGS